MKKKGKATSLKHLTGKIASWNNLGYADEDTSRYVEEISRDNLRAIGMYSGLGVFALNLVLVLCCPMNSAPMSLVLLYLAGSVLSAGLWCASRYFLRQDRDIARAGNVLGLIFTIFWFALTMYVDIVHSPQTYSVILCLAFFALPVMLDVFPYHSLTMLMAALGCAYMLELR